MQQRGWEAYAGKLGVDVMQKTQKCLDWICSRVEGEYVLDADCGQAATLMLLAREGKTVVGLCSRPTTWTQASSFIGEEPAQVRRNITLQTGSLSSAHTLADRSFDTVLLPQSVVQEEHPGDHVEIAFRKLKPGGRLISLWPFGALAPSGAGYFLREPMKLLARHFEALEVRLFGDVLVIVANARPKVLERIPANTAWPDSLIQEAESTATQLQQASIGQLKAAQSQAQELRQELEEANARLTELIQQQAEHETQAATLEAQLDSMQHAEREAASTAEEDVRQLKALKESQETAVTAQQAAVQTHVQARILDLEKVQEIAVLRYEKLQREATLREAQPDAELKIDQARAEVSEASEALSAARQELTPLRQRVQDTEATAAAREKVFGKLMEDLQQSLGAKQQEIAEGKLRIDELVEMVSQRESAILKLDEEVAELRHSREALTAEKQQVVKDLERERENTKRREKEIQIANAERTEGNEERSHIEFSLKTLNTQLIQAHVSSQDVQNANAATIRDFEQKLSLAEKRVVASEARLKDAQLKARDIVAQYRASQESEKAAAEKIRHLERRVRNLQHEKEQALLQVEQTRKTLSFQLGYALLHGFKSWSAFVGLPSELFRIHKEGKIRRERRRLKQQAGNGKSGTMSKPAPKKPLIAPSKPMMLRTPAAGNDAQSKKMRIAAVMDEFTYHSYAPECELLQLRPEIWESQVTEFKPDLVFIESAWKGVDDLWQRKVSNCTEEVRAVLTWAKKNNVPSMFWNKEDPVHFSTFIELASLVDHVFTTDIDCIPKYKKILGHNRIYLLPFAAQPSTHNPIEIYDRKDAFNFAGSYYLRYPERQRDFSALVDTVQKFRPVEIYDRNFEKPHPHYQFPEKYSKYILGSLKFNEIDRAYKGYRYGINMNTIKQSQTMFARRVFELLASNTIVVSNFSRGTRLLFGDLVISSDEANQIETRIRPLYNDELAYRKFRLAGLRKVMAEHTYRHRLQYIKAKLSNSAYSQQIPPVIFVASADSADALDSVHRAFLRQTHEKSQLCVLTSFKEPTLPPNSRIKHYTSVDALSSEVMRLTSAYELIGLLHSLDHYGRHYAEDLAWASTYGPHAQAFGKAAHYGFENETTILRKDGSQYREATAMPLRRAVVRITEVADTDISRWLSSPDNEHTGERPGLAVDEFNYCERGASASKDALSVPDDVPLPRSGVSFAHNLAPLAEGMTPAEKLMEDSDDDLPSLSGPTLAEHLVPPASKMITVSADRDVLRVRSRLPQEKYAYIYVRNAYTREELNMVLNSQFTLVCEDPGEVRTVFEFQDKNRQKISHSMMGAEGTHALAIPNECTHIRFGLRIQGTCDIKIHKLVLGSHGEKPSMIVGRSDILVLTKQYPAYDDLYKYGFLHTRVRAYARSGVPVEIFRINSNPTLPYREFEDIDVATGDAALLRKTLETGQYRHVLVHILDNVMWSVLKDFLHKVKVTVWAHGSEIQVWQRREYEFSDLEKDQVVRKKKLSDNRRTFWREVFNTVSSNLSFVFVSEWLKKTTEEDIGITLSADRYQVIPNFIDGSLFQYSEKTQEDRKRILSIRPYANRTYANDLTVEAILQLSKKAYFPQLQIELCGDGELFDRTTAPLAEFANVKLSKGFLTHSEISAKHKQYGIFLTPTRMDTQGVSRDEAMSSGLVPVTSDVAAVREFVSDKEGMICQPESPDALATAIDGLINDEQDFLRKSKAAHERVSASLNTEQTIDREIVLFAA